MNTKRIHVVHIIQSLGYGGAERFIVDLINFSDPDLFKFTVITFFPHHELAAQIKTNATVVCVPKVGKVSWQLVGDLAAKLRELKPDIIHTHLFAAELWGRLAAKRVGVPVVSTMHNIDVADGFVRNGIKRLMTSYTKRYAAASQAIQKYAITQLGVKTNTIELIRYGIDTALYKKCVQPTFEAPLKILMLGRITKQKGPLIALNALARIQQLPWHFTMVGEGDMQKQVRGEIKKLGLEKRVTVLPPTANVAQVLSQHDMLFMPSLWEGLGIVIMEAMSAGRLVVASSTGGIPEIVTHEKTGFLVPPGNSADFARQIAWCIEHPSECAAVAQAGRAFAQAHFGTNEMVGKYANLYGSVIK